MRYWRVCLSFRATLFWLDSSPRFLFATALPHPSLLRSFCDLAYSGFPPRRSFKSRAFATEHHLKPVAAISFRASYDDLVPVLHKRLQPPAAE